MSLAPWIVPALWLEPDWPAGLVQLARRLGRAPREPRTLAAELELADAFAYLHPDRREAIYAYERAGSPGSDRARALACEIGWWPGCARLALAARRRDPDPALALVEAEAWWDAGHRQLCALALADVDAPELRPRVRELQALIASRDLVQHCAAAAARGDSATGDAAAADFVMAARFARAAGRVEDSAGYLERALLAAPGHAIAAASLLALAITRADPTVIQDALRKRLADLEETAWFEAVRASAQLLIASVEHRGLGLRMLRQLLARAYATQCTDIPGHLGVWHVLATQAAADGTRRELLPLVVDALDLALPVADRVWLAALGAEICLRDAGDVAVAGAYTRVVIEHAPDLPIVREVLTAAAVQRPRDPTGPHRRDLGAGPGAGSLFAAATGAPADPTERAWAQLEDALEVEVDIEVDVDGLDFFDVAVARAIAPPPDPAVPHPAVPPASPRRAQSPTQPFSPQLRAPGRVTALPFAVRPPALTPSIALAALATMQVARRPGLPSRAPDPPDARPRAPRLTLPLDVRLTYLGHAITACARDISTTGLFVITSESFAVGDEVELEVELPAKDEFSQELHRSRARVARLGAGGFGLELMNPGDALVAALATLTR